MRIEAFRGLPLMCLSLILMTSAAAAQSPDVAAEAATAEAVQPQRVPFLRPSGAYADLPELGFSPMSLLGGGGAPPKAFFPFVDQVRGLAELPEVEVLLDLSESASFNLPQLRELERAIEHVHAAGKQIVCYVENIDSGLYQLAAQCDRVLMADMGMVDLRSPAMSVMHMRDALDLLGVKVDVTRVGAFKGAVEPYMLPQMSDHLRHHYEAMLSSMNQDILRRIAAGRKMPIDKVRSLQQQRLFTAKEALLSGLVDRLVPWCGAEHALAMQRGEAPFELVDAAPKERKKRRDFMSMLSSMFNSKDEEEIEEPEIVVLHLAGEIVDGSKPAPGSMVSGPSVERIDQLAANDEVKGVVVRINSPGGSASASEAIRLALQRLAAKKPVVFSMGELAASGGYWITTIGRPILAEATTITGSIGVFGMRFETGALMRRIGVHTDIVRLDDGPLMDAMDRPWSDEARAKVQGFVDEIYERFLANVGASRHKTVEQVDGIAGGRVWSGQQAVDNGLVDAIGGVGDAVAMVRKSAGVGDEVQVRHVPEPKNFADAFLTSLFDAQVGAQVGGGIDGATLRGVLTAIGDRGELLGVLRDALLGDGRLHVRALMPAGLRVR